jgi:hypothetical protein
MRWQRSRSQPDNLIATLGVWPARLSSLSFFGKGRFFGLLCFRQRRQRLAAGGLFKIAIFAPGVTAERLAIVKDQFEPTLESSALDRRDLSLRLIGTANAERHVEAEKQIKNVRR